MHSTRAVSVPPSRPLARDHRALLSATLATLFWLGVLWDAARRVADAGLEPLPAALAGVFSQLVFTGIESAFACAAWAALGASVRWRELAPRLLAVSTVEAIAVAIAMGGLPLPSGVAVLLAGARAASDGAAATTNPALAALGILTMLRIAMSAGVQARLARAPFARGLFVVGAFYLATRLAMWWTFGLLQGHSFEPWGSDH